MWDLKEKTCIVVCKFYFQRVGTHHKIDHVMNNMINTILEIIIIIHVIRYTVSLPMGSTPFEQKSRDIPYTLWTFILSGSSFQQGAHGGVLPLTRDFKK